MKVIFKGFTSDKQARAFAGWYSNQGEQDSQPWIEEHTDCSFIGMESIVLTKDEITVIVKPILKEGEPIVKRTIEEIYKEKGDDFDPFDYTIRGNLYDPDGEEMDWENWCVNKVEGNIIHISHGGDWQEPKQGIYEFDGVDTLTLLEEGFNVDFSKC